MMYKIVKGFFILILMHVIPSLLPLTLIKLYFFKVEILISFTEEHWNLMCVAH